MQVLRRIWQKIQKIARKNKYIAARKLLSEIHRKKCHRKTAFKARETE